MKLEASRVTEVIDKVKKGIVTEEDISEIANYNAMNYDMMVYLKLFKELYFNQKKDLINILIDESKSSKYSSFFQYFFDDSVKKTKDNYTKAISSINYYKNLDVFNEIIDFMERVDIQFYCVGLENIYFSQIRPFFLSEKKKDNYIFNIEKFYASTYDRIEIDSIHFEYLQPIQLLKIYEGCSEEEKEKFLKKIKKLPTNSFTLKFSSDNIDEQLKMYNNYPPLTILELTYLEKILKGNYNYINGFDSSIECYSLLSDYYEQNQHAENKDLFFEIIYNDIIPHYAKDNLKDHSNQSEIIVDNILEFKKYIERCKYYNRTDIRIILRFTPRDINKKFEKETIGFSEEEEKELYNTEDYENAYIDYGGIDRDGFLSLNQFKSSLNFYNGVADYINQLGLSEIEKYIVLYYLTKIFKKYKYYKGDKGADKKYHSISRNPYLIIHNPYIVCKGYSNFMIKVGQKVGLNIKEIGVHFPKKSNHARVITRFNDLKYDVKGIYIGDPTFDNCDIFSFEKILLSSKDVKKELEAYCITNEAPQNCYSLERSIMEMLDQNSITRIYDQYSQKQKIFVESLGKKIDKMKLIGIFRNILEKIYYDDENKVEQVLRKIIEYSYLDCLELYKLNSIESCKEKLFRIYKDINLTEDGTRYFTYYGIAPNNEHDYLKTYHNNGENLQLRFNISDKSLEEDDYNNLVSLFKEAFANNDVLDFNYVEDKPKFETDLFSSYIKNYFHMSQIEPSTKKLFVYIKVNKKEKLVDFNKELMKIMCEINNIISEYCLSRKISKYNRL